MKFEGERSEIHEYEGVQRPSKSLALFYNPVDKAFTIEKLDANFLFNLHSTPAQKDPTALAAEYAHLDSGPRDSLQDGDDLFDEADNDDQGAREQEPPDPSNPYDYRHFLNRNGRSPSPAPSAVSSPVPSHYPSAHSPALSAASPVTPRPSATSRSKQKQETVRDKPRYLSPIPSREVDEGDAGPTGDDPDELIIDMGDSAPIQNKPWRSALGILNEGRSSGPISLRSAASSMSPSIRGEESDGGKDEHSADENDDVEDIDLANTTADTPGVHHEDAATPGNGWDDNEDDLEAELELALGDQAEEEDLDREAGGVALNEARQGNHVVEDSSSESEEE